jgi:hypothetical protein
MAAPKRPQLNKMAKGKAAPMSRTSGTARRLTGRSEGIATKLKYGAPLTGSASGVKSISLKDVGETLTQGAFSVNRKGLTTDAANLAMALPLGKLAKASKALRAIGGARNRSVAAALTERLRSKAAGKSFGQSLSENKAAGGGPILQYIANAGAGARKASESVFPRATKANVSEGTLNIIDTRRMSPAQAKAALEGGVSQTAKIARRIPGKEKPVRGATARLLKGRGK